MGLETFAGVAERSFVAPIDAKLENRMDDTPGRLFCGVAT